MAECSLVAGPQVQREHQMTTLLALSTWEKMALQNNRLETCKLDRQAHPWLAAVECGWLWELLDL